MFETALSRLVMSAALLLMLVSWAAVANLCELAESSTSSEVRTVPSVVKSAMPPVPRVMYESFVSCSAVRPVPVPPLRASPLTA